MSTTNTGKPGEDRTDWAALEAMADAEVNAAASSDPDCPPSTAEQLARFRRVSRAKFVRQSLALTQEAFAERFRIPLGTLRDWEQGASTPDAAAQAYLRVIEREPEAVARALAAEAVPGK